MTKGVKIKGKIKLFVILLIVLGALLLLGNIPIYFLDIKAGIAVSVFVLVYFAVFLCLWFYLRSYLIEELISFATEYGQIQKQILKELKLPHALMDDAGKIIWTNVAFESLTGVSASSNKTVMNIISDISKDKFPQRIRTVSF